MQLRIEKRIPVLRFLERRHTWKGTFTQRFGHCSRDPCLALSKRKDGIGPTQCEGLGDDYCRY